MIILQETDAALLCILGYPAFAVVDEKLHKETKERLVSTLQVVHQYNFSYIFAALDIHTFIDLTFGMGQCLLLPLNGNP